MKHVGFCSTQFDPFELVYSWGANKLTEVQSPHKEFLNLTVNIMNPAFYPHNRNIC